MGGGVWSLFLKEKPTSRFDALLLCFKYALTSSISFKMPNEKESNVYAWMYMCNRVLKQVMLNMNVFDDQVVL